MRTGKRGWVVLGFSIAASIAACDDGGGTGGGGTTSSSTASTASSTSSTASSSTSGSSSASGSTSSTSTSSSTGSGAAAAECTSAADCKTIGNCCTCESIPQNDTLPMCNMMGCGLDKCMEGGLPPGGGACVVGHCNAGFDCDSTHVVCLAPTPQCAPGEVPSVNGACWGTCIKATECAYVDACAACGPTQACVHYGGGVMKTYCVDVAPECGGKASCACMGQSLCGAVPCGEQNGELTCQAP